jgi:hypothetical protein
MLCPSHTPSLDLPNNVWCRVQITNYRILVLLPASQLKFPSHRFRTSLIRDLHSVPKQQVTLLLHLVCTHTVWPQTESRYHERTPQPVLEKINNYKHKWIQRVRRMDRSRHPLAIMKYQPTGERKPGRPMQNLLDSCTDIGTGHVA